MKKNLISVLILALVLANFVLTALLMFTVMPQTKKANELIDKVCAAIDLDLNSGAANALGNIPMDQREEYKVNGGADITTSLAPSVDPQTGQSESKSHYAVVNVTLVLYTESEKHETYTQEFLAGQDTSIMNSIQKTLSQYTIEEVRESSTKEEIQEIILQDMQAMFGGDYVIAVNFSKFQQE